MKKLYSLLFACAMVLSTQLLVAQVKAPAASPACKMTQTVGLTDISLEYARPGVKGRTIFGDLVPYDKMWRTGANKNSIVTFSDDVMVGDQKLAKGSYAIFATPGKSSWKVDFYTDTENWGTPREWDASKVAGSVMLSPSKTSAPVERFAITVENMTDTGADLVIAWADTKVAMPITVPTDELVMATIDKTMAGPSANDYYSAGRYYRDSGKDLNKALEYINKSLEIGGDRFWIVRQKALTLAKMGKYKDAIATAEKSIALAKEAGNEGYVKNNMKSIAEWTKMK